MNERIMHRSNIRLDSLEAEPVGNPNDCESYFVYAEWLDGTPLTEEELSDLTDTWNMYDELYRICWT